MKPYEVKERLDILKSNSTALKGLVEMERCASDSNLKSSLCELVNLRVTQINGCNKCLGMHVRNALATGECEQRLAALDQWEDSSLFSERERAALAWTEALTLIAAHEIPDELYRTTRGYFSEEDLVALTFCVIATNGWNRLSKCFHTVCGGTDQEKNNTT